MATDPNLVDFDSNWNVDQIIKEGTFSVPLSGTAVEHLIVHGYNRKPFVTVQYSANGGVLWTEPGGLGMSNVTASVSISTTTIKIRFSSSNTLTVQGRYWIYADGR